MTPLVEAPFWAALAARGDAPALVSTGSTVVSYAELADRVEALAQALGTTRRLVLLEASNDVDTVVGYLACLVGGHPVLVVDGNRSSEPLLSTYDPDVVFGAGLTERRPGTKHELHPDLALLMSTSGSTGSPKLVRLSHTNVSSNAAAIAAYLQLRSTDVAASTLPLHYCYGLSVLASHLAAGASVLLTSDSVVDASFWQAVTEHGVTTFPGVPHTFDLLDRVGFEAMDLPSLRYLTCAGGRLAPATVSRFAALGQRKGFDLFVMYGATEATARMSYLPPDLALTHPASIGVPIPGGALSIEGGELVYRGDNVMMGYASSAADLGRGPGLNELRTGDLARISPAGLVEIVGRVSRFAKVFGLRLDLDRVETALLSAGVVAYAADAGDRVVVGVDRTAAPVDESLVREVVSHLGVPVAGLDVVPLDGVPRLASGKPDYRAVAQLSAARHEPQPELSAARHQWRGRDVDGARGIAGVLGEVLRRSDVGDADTFVSLGGDSLSYVAMSLRLESLLGRLPRNWHQLSVAELEGRAVRGAGGSSERAASPRTAVGGPRSEKAARRWGRTVETNVLLRAAAIVLIVGSHSNLFMLLGGAHLLLGLAGFNFGRFHVTDRPRAERVRRLSGSIIRIVVPSVLWMSFAALTSWKYGPLNVALLNGVLGSREWTESWHYWFIEALVWTLVALAALLAIPRVHALERRNPFWFAMGLALLALLTRYDVVRLFDGDHIHRAHVIFWIFALGWATAKATSHWHRALVSLVGVATLPGFFDGSQLDREATIAVGMLLLIWLPSVKVPASVARMAGVLASASLYIYLCHWQIYPAYEFELPWLATGLSLAAGIAFWQVVTRVTPAIERGGSWAWREIRQGQRWFKPRRYPSRDPHPAAPRAASQPVRLAR